MDTERRKLITPVTLETKDYAHEWQSIQYTPKPIGPAISNHLTDKGETVRSKSEVIIANTLARQQIPYRYEYPVKLKTYTAHPDFYCLNLRTRQEYLWEHLGRSPCRGRYVPGSAPAPASALASFRRLPCGGQLRCLPQR